MIGWHGGLGGGTGPFCARGIGDDSFLINMLYINIFYKFLRGRGYLFCVCNMWQRGESVLLGIIWNLCTGQYLSF